MTIQHVFAQAAVSQVEPAVRWYSVLFEREPTARPMDGLVEWHLTNASGVQVWLDPERAGRSSIVLADTDLDALAARLDAAGLAHGPITEVTASRIIELRDPDGNLLVITGR